MRTCNGMVDPRLEVGILALRLLSSFLVGLEVRALGSYRSMAWIIGCSCSHLSLKLGTWTHLTRCDTALLEG